MINQPVLGKMLANTGRVNSKKLISPTSRLSAISGWRRGLLVEADLNICQQDQLGPFFEIILEQSLVVVRKRLAQVFLPLRRFSEKKLVAEAGNLFVIRLLVEQAGLVEAGKLTPDLCEDLFIAPADCRARNGPARP
jgi:hypothetical protein